MKKINWKGFAGRLLGLGLAFILAFSTLPVMNVSAAPDGATGDVYYGDVNGDNKIDSKDVTLLRRHIAGGWNVVIDEGKADVNMDGKVDSKDVTLLRRYIAGGWGVEMPPMPVFEPWAVGFNQISLDSLRFVFDMPISVASAENITVYYMDGDERAYLNTSGCSKSYDDENVLILKFDAPFVQGETLYAEYKGKSVGSIKTTTVDANSVVVVVIPIQKFRIGSLGRLSYQLLDANGIDITSLLGTTLQGIVQFEFVDGDMDTYITNGTTPDIYIGTPYKTYTVKGTYTWFDANGNMRTVYGQGSVVGVPEDPWQLGVGQGVITHDSDQNYVNNDHTGYNSVQKVDPVTLDYDDLVLQIAIPYTRYGRTEIDTLDYVSGKYTVTYPGKESYIAYEIKSSDDTVVMLGNTDGNKTKLVLNNSGSAGILIYGIKANGERTVIGAVPIQVFPKKNPALNNLNENYVYNNTILSELRITAADADGFVSENGTKNSAIASANCSMDAPEANVIQIAVPYTNIDGTIYGGLEGGPLSDEFTEYVVESSDESVIELGEIASGKMKFTCKKIGTVTISLYGKSADGEKLLLDKKEVKVSRSKVDLPEVKSVSQVSLDTVKVVFDRNVEDMALWTGDFTCYYYVTETTKGYFGNIQSVTVNEDEVLIKFNTNLVQDKQYDIEFVGDLAGSFKSAKIDANSVATIVVDPQKIQPNEFTQISYHFLDANGVDITGADVLHGGVYFEIKNHEKYSFATIDGTKICLTEDDSACIVRGAYYWVDAEGATREVSSEAVFSTGEGTISSSGSGSDPIEYPVEPVPAQLEVYTYRGSSELENRDSKINAAYDEDTLNILIKVYDQYAQPMEDCPVSIERVDTSSQAGYSGADTLLSGEIYTLKASEVSGNGVLTFRLKCGEGDYEVIRTLCLLVGNDDMAATYTPVISDNLLDTTVTEDSVQQCIEVGLEGRTIGGFRTRGPAIMFVESTPTTGQNNGSGGGTSFVYTVKKDGRIMRFTDLRYNFSGNTFYNVIENYGYAVKMPSGNYTVEFYEISYAGQTRIVHLIGNKQFTVEDHQGELLSVTPTENVNKLTEISAEAIAQVFKVAFNGKEANADNLAFKYMVNGAGDAAYVASADYVVKNNNGLGSLNLWVTVDAVARKVPDPDAPVVLATTEPAAELGDASGIFTYDGASDYVVNGSINPNCTKVSAVTMDYSGNVDIQIAVPYTKDGATVIETPGSTSVSGYTDYILRSNDESIVMLGEKVSANKTRLLLNKVGYTSISIYGVRTDGNLEFISEIPINVCAARRVTTFSVTFDKNKINLAYAADRIQFNIDVRDQYGDRIYGKYTTIQKMNGQVEFYGASTTDQYYRLYPSAIYITESGSFQPLSLRFTCENLSMITTITVGNDPVAAKYIPMLSSIGMSIADADPERPKYIVISLQGVTKHGFSAPGAPIYFTGTMPTPSNSYDDFDENIADMLKSSGRALVYTVKKDGALLTADELPTMENNCFVNCRYASDGSIVTMAPGEYNISCFEIKDGSTIAVTAIGTCAFTVTE